MRFWRKLSGYEMQPGSGAQSAAALLLFVEL